MAGPEGVRLIESHRLAATLYLFFLFLHWKFKGVLVVYYDWKAGLRLIANLKPKTENCETVNCLHHSNITLLLCFLCCLCVGLCSLLSWVLACLTVGSCINITMTGPKQWTRICTRFTAAFIQKCTFKGDSATTVFCKMSGEAITWGRLKISRWPFYPCTIFGAHQTEIP